ncbi:MAG: copper resistance protein [Alphaproteobacteria bacterium]|nr:copper resistance protein [Alphaproteobacteria bacterium]
MRIGRIVAMIAACLVALVPGAATAAASAWWENEHGAVRLIASTGAAGDTDRLDLGLHFRMRPGWKIYWRSPGDAGFPPQPDWAGSSNVAEVTIAWPAPMRFSVLGFETLGYENEVVLPLVVETFERGQPVRLKASVPYLTCDDICVPYEAELALTLPAGPETSTPEAPLIERFRTHVPSREPDERFAIVAAAATSGERPILDIELRANRPLGRPDVFIEGPRGLTFAAPRVEIRDGGHGAVLRVAVAGDRSLASTLAGQTLTLTAVDGMRAVEQTVAVAASAVVPLPPPVPAATGLFAILAIAVLGGLILNLMPCVLPVLSLKLLSVIDAGGVAPARVRARFLATSAGIVASFLVLAAVAVGLKAAGLAAGWGIQFQEPVFLAVMAVVLMLFAANLWGAFSIALPSAVADRAAAAGGGRDGLAGHFATGAFATLLATPCSAPFVGTAVGFALARGAGEIYAVFGALGIGLALPYLAVAAWPRLARRLPRPGRWMVTLRIVLGLALAATAVWLLTVLAVQRGSAIAAAVGVVVAAIPALLFLAARGSEYRRAARSGVAMLVVLALALPSLWRADPPAGPATVADRLWRPFDTAAIAAEVAGGRVVFVDVTAEWCVTCQVNKAVVLDRADIRRRLEDRDVVAMRADWTRPDPAIAGYLASFGRYGIPFNAVYGPGSPSGIALPELLTPEVVRDAMDRAASVPVASRR